VHERRTIVLALVWWAWSGFVWAANAEEEESRAQSAVWVLALATAVVVAVCALEETGNDLARWSPSSSSSR